METENIEVEYEIVSKFDKQLYKISNDPKVIFIIASVERNTGLLFEDFIVQNRKRLLTGARQLAMYFIRKNTTYSLNIIAQYCGNRNHGSVLHSSKVVSNLFETNEPNFRALYRRINNDIDQYSDPILVKKSAVIISLLEKYVCSLDERKLWLKQFYNAK